MIDFYKFNTAKLLEKYKDNRIFPRLYKKGTIKFLKDDSINTHQKLIHCFSSIFKGSPFDIKKYLEISLNYSLQSLIKGISLYSYSELVDTSMEKNYSIKFLNLYYSHIFLSYSILQFNGIVIDFEKDKSVTYDKFLINIKYLDLYNNSLEEFKTTKSEKKKDINHKNFWEIYYGIIKNNKSEFFLDLIPGCGGYFMENNFLDKKNESECRNFYTYNYSSVTQWDLISKKTVFNEIIKTNTRGINNAVHELDFNKIKTTVEKELTYLMGLYKKLSFKNDFEKELLSIFNNPIMKTNKNKIIDGVEDFLYELNTYI